MVLLEPKSRFETAMCVFSNSPVRTEALHLLLGQHSPGSALELSEENLHNTRRGERRGGNARGGGGGGG